jgi:hypothetical protein
MDAIIRYWFAATVERHQLPTDAFVMPGISGSRTKAAPAAGGMTMETVIDYNGKIAIEWQWWTEQQEPKQTKYIHASDIDAADWPLLIGALVDGWNVNTATIFKNGRAHYLDTSGWVRVEEERPVTKPRKGTKSGMAYDWQWERGEWRRVWLQEA